jgi:hypothetical protein
MLVVFEVEGTLWCRVKPKDKPPAEAILVARGKQTMHLHLGLHEVLAKMLESNIAKGFGAQKQHRRKRTGLLTFLAQTYMADCFSVGLLICPQMLVTGLGLRNLRRLQCNFPSMAMSEFFLLIMST